MKVEIDIIDRIYYNIETLCSKNGTDILEYMSDAVVERYNLDKYGDLNKKIEKRAEKPVGKKPKTVEVQNKIEEQAVDMKKEIKAEEKTQISIENQSENKQIERKIRKRTLNSK